MLDHRAGGGLGAEKGPFQVGIQYGVPIGFGNFQGRGAAADAGIVHQNIQPAKIPDYGRHRFADVGQVQHIQGIDPAFYALSLDAPRRFLRAGQLFRQVGYGYLSPGLGQAISQRAANAPPGAGNQGGPPRQAQSCVRH